MHGTRMAALPCTGVLTEAAQRCAPAAGLPRPASCVFLLLLMHGVQWLRWCSSCCRGALMWMRVMQISRRPCTMQRSVSTVRWAGIWPSCCKCSMFHAQAADTYCHAAVSGMCRAAACGRRRRLEGQERATAPGRGSRPQHMGHLEGLIVYSSWHWSPHTEQRTCPSWGTSSWAEAATQILKCGRCTDI